jgi:hypothetical protein
MILAARRVDLQRRYSRCSVEACNDQPNPMDDSDGSIELWSIRTNVWNPQEGAGGIRERVVAPDDAAGVVVVQQGRPAVGADPGVLAVVLQAQHVRFGVLDRDVLVPVRKNLNDQHDCLD